MPSLIRTTKIISVGKFSQSLKIQLDNIRIHHYCLFLRRDSSWVGAIVSTIGYYQSYSQLCSKPIALWLIVALFLVGILRGLLMILEKTESNSVFKLASIIILAVYFPIFILWTLLGTSWFNSIHKESPECIKDNVRWVTVFWISISYFLIFTYIATILTILLEKVCIP